MKKPTYLLTILLFVILSSEALIAQSITFTGGELLGCPTDNSIIINIVPASNIELFYEYGTSSGVYTLQTSTTSATGGQPHEIKITGLQADTRYYYRMQYRTSGGSWVTRGENFFQTQRAEGSTFKFTVTSDSHASFNTAHQQAMTNVKNDQPDFHLDLGDTFYPDNSTSQSAVNTKYLAYRNSLYMGAIGPTVPIFLSAGNHENEEGWNIDDSPFSIAVGSTQARKAYYPTPVQDGFYSGNTDPLALIDEGTYGNELREDYYAWEWGDALFVVIDPFQYTMNLPYAAGAAGEGNDDAMTGDQWNWTLGAQQFNWFKQTIQNSNAKYKFVFSHQVTGGILTTVAGVGPGYVRGGGGAAPYFEWGGKNADGTDGFASHRNPAEFGTIPIHQLMVQNGVSAYFHGHDHQYVYEKRDGIVYQEVPSPSMSGSGFSGIYSEGDHGDYNTIKMLPSTGHLRITINPAQATVDYVRSDQTAVSYSYTILPNTSTTNYSLTMAIDAGVGGTTTPAAGNHVYNENAVVNITATPAAGYHFDHWTGNVANAGTTATTVTMSSDQVVTAFFVQDTPTGKAGDMNGDGSVNSTDALIILSCDAGIDVSQFCPVNCGDVNSDGLVNSTDALIILSYDAGITVPFQVGQAGCPSSITPCPGCSK